MNLKKIFNQEKKCTRLFLQLSALRELAGLVGFSERPVFRGLHLCSPSEVAKLTGRVLLVLSTI